MTTLKGLILKEDSRGESSKSITVLTAERGVIHIFVRGGRKSTKNSSATQAFSYSSLCLEEKRQADGQVNYYLNSSESIKIFYNIRLDPKKLALASYFAELLIFSGVENSDCTEVMRLTLNTVYFLNEGKKDTDLLKSIFEFRLLCEIGLLPKLLGCCECCVCEHDEMHFDFITNSLTCGDCYKEKENGEESINETVMDRTMLYIVRFIALTDYERLFSFRISEQYQERVTEFTERFVSYHLKGKFVTLDFYKTIK